MGDYKIIPYAEKVLHHSLYIVIYHYITGKDSQRYIDSFRGALNFSFNLGHIGLDSFIFLLNFLCWLENKTLFGEDDSLEFDEFMKFFLKDMNEKI